MKRQRPQKLRTELRKDGVLSIRRGTRTILVRTKLELERVGHQALDAAILLGDSGSKR
jgi:hypothetical protein